MAAQGVPPSDEFAADYAAFLHHYDDVQCQVTEIVAAFDLCGAVGRQFGWNAVGRTKSRETLLAKLRQEPTPMNLDSIRDVAGVRIVANCTLSEQDAIVANLADRFDCTKEPVDRRSSPASGYRAVHLEIRFDETPVEVQIRTRLQHIWAEIYEKTAEK